MKAAGLFLLFFSLFASNIGIAQEVLNLNKTRLLPVERLMIQSKSMNHTAIKPFLVSDLRAIVNTDSLFDFSLRDEPFVKTLKHPWLIKKLRNEDLFFVKTEDLTASINPIIDFNLGSDNSSSGYYTNTRGAIVKATIGKTIFVQTLFSENQATFPKYIREFIDSNNIVPGQGRAKKFKENGYDYSFAEGLISYSPSMAFNFQFGHGKLFIGDGYRSLFLSDNAFNYPYLKMTYSSKSLQYSTIYACFQDVNFTIDAEAPFQKKYATFHYLSYSISKNLNVGLFQSTIWQARTSNKNIGFRTSYLIPVLFVQPAISGLNGIDNSSLGVSVNANLFKKIKIYSQLLIDGMDKQGSVKNKKGYQLGLCYYDVANVKNLFFQTEYNRVNPYTYAQSNTLQNYTHYNQALAHPLGANFKEALAIINYKINDFIIELKLNYAVYGADTGSTHYGKNIFYSDFFAQNGYYSSNNKIIQGVHTSLTRINFQVDYLLNPKSCLMIMLGATYRKEESSQTKNNLLYYYGGIKTSIFNNYSDF